MATTDEQIAHALADRQVQLFRYDAGLTNEAKKKIEALSLALVALLRSYGREPMNKKQLAGFQAKAKKLVDATYSEIEQRIGKQLDGFGAIEAAAVAGILNAAQGGSVALPKLDAVEPTLSGVPMSEYWRQSSDTTFMQVYEVAARDAVNGKSPIDTAENPDLSLGTRVVGAAGLVRTVVMSMASDARMGVYSLFGAQGYIHTSILDGKTSLMCLARSGAMWDANFEPINGTDFAFERPPLHRHCRSYIRPYFGGDVAKVNQDSWLNSKTEKQQNDLLGKGKADLWRREVITFRDMLDQSGRPLSLAELKDLNEVA